MEILTLTMTPFAENCFVIKDSGEAMIIDPGESNAALWDSIGDDKVTTILLTHSHIDHVGGVAEAKERTGAPIVCHKEAVSMLQNVSQQGAMFGFQVPNPPDPDKLIDEGDVVKVGSVEMKVVNVPGHAPGHIALIGDGYVIGGDVLFAGSIGRTDLPGGSYEQLISSIKNKLLTLPDDTIVYCGHGPSTTVGAERISNPFLLSS